VDVGFVRTISSDELFQVETLSREPLVLAIPGEHPMAVRKRVTLRDFAEDSFIFLPRTVGPGFYDAAISSCERAGFAPRIAQEVAEWQTALALVAAGLGVALVPESVKNWQRPGVVYCDLRGETAEIELKLIWRRHELTPVIETFINVARQVARLSQKKIGRL
jgi:DNA-binding transcriptional LysR family regulator